MTANYSLITVEYDNGVGIIRLNRPTVLNALCREMLIELSQALDMLEEDERIGALMITGNERAFAAGADLTEIQKQEYIDRYQHKVDALYWQRLSRCRKPVIAAVAGYALGGGCELAMMCDVILAADNAKFGQPEVTIGLMPGSGGTQRLTRLVGRTRAMELCLTGRMIDAAEAERYGLVTRVVPASSLMAEARELAARIARFSQPVVMMIKESIQRVDEMSLSEGLRFEDALFYSGYATDDRAEGVKAFLEKRKPTFQNR